MARDDELAGRMRAALADEPGLVEKRMFGGLAFLVGGHLAASASSRGGMLLRADPARSGELLAEPGVAPFEMRGRPMAGWLHVDAAVLEDDDDLARWLDLGLGYARTLPPKDA